VIFSLELRPGVATVSGGEDDGTGLALRNGDTMVSADAGDVVHVIAAAVALVPSRYCPCLLSVVFAMGYSL
jgi:hypothetical protein